MKTAKIHKLEGTYRPDRHSPEGVEAPLMARIPSPPDYMNEIAAKFWQKKCLHLKEMGRLHAVDLESLEAYCNVLSDMQKAREMMDKAWGQDVFYRYQKAYNEAYKLQVTLAKEFGFTPASRGKIKGGTEQKEASDFENI